MENPARIEERSPDGIQTVRVHQFRGVQAITHETLPPLIPGEGQVLVRGKAAGVEPWDAWVRDGKSALHPPPPLIAGSDRSGVVEEFGSGVARFEREVKDVDLVMDTVGGERLDRSLEVLKPRGVFISSVASLDADETTRKSVQSFIVTVTLKGLNRITVLLDSGRHKSTIGEIVPWPKGALHTRCPPARATGGARSSWLSM